MIVDINHFMNTGYPSRAEVSYKIVDFNKPSRIMSFTYYSLYSDTGNQSINERRHAYSNYWFWNFFSSAPVVITTGNANKHFIKQFVSNVYDIYEDDIQDIPLARQIRGRRCKLTPNSVNEWKNPSMCPASKCRYRHTGYCTFKNLQCMIEWMNDPIF